MDDDFPSLEKEAEIVLTKRQLLSVRARVGCAIDLSGSMSNEYQDGTVQRTVDRFLALLNKLDDNGEMDMWGFNTGVRKLPLVNRDNHVDYVVREIIKKRFVGGGTHYEPFLIDSHDGWFINRTVEQQSVKQKPSFLGKLFGAKDSITSEVKVRDTIDYSGVPALLTVVTDGDNADQDASEAMLLNMQRTKVPMYVAFVGIGDDTDFNWIRRMGDKFDNVGFLRVKDIRRISDEDLYHKFVTEELASWLKTH